MVVVRQSWNFMPVRGEWQENYAAAFTRAGRNALELSMIRDIGFLPSLAGLKALRVTSKTLTNDLPALRCPELVDLDLYTNSKRGLEFDESSPLVNVKVQARKGLESIGALSQLRELSLYSYALPDMRWVPKGAQWESLSTAAPLRSSPVASIEGLQCASTLKSLHLAGLSPECSLEPLASLESLEGLTLAYDRKAERAPVDLSPVSRLPVTSVYLYNVDVQSWAPLQELPRLKKVYFEQVRCVDGSNFESEGVKIV